MNCETSVSRGVADRPGDTVRGEGRGATFRKPRMSDLEPSLVPAVSLEYPAGCSPGVPGVRIIDGLACQHRVSEACEQ